MFIYSFLLWSFSGTSVHMIHTRISERPSWITANEMAAKAHNPNAIERHPITANTNCRQDPISHNEKSFDFTLIVRWLSMQNFCHVTLEIWRDCCQRRKNLCVCVCVWRHHRVQWLKIGSCSKRLYFIGSDAFVRSNCVTMKPRYFDNRIPMFSLIYLW